MTENQDKPFPEPPYYAVIFTSVRTQIDEGYHETNEMLARLAAKQKGYLGMESFREESGFGVSIIYWKSLKDIKAWGKNPKHLLAQNSGREKWYKYYNIRICKVENEREFSKADWDEL